MTYSKEARAILNLLSKFGSLTTSQINKLFEGTKYNPGHLMSFLIKTRYIKMVDNDYAVVQNRKTYDKDTLACIWVMIDRIKKDALYETTEVEGAACCIDDGGINLCYIRDNKVIEYIAFIDMDKLTTVAYIQDSFYTSSGVSVGKEEESNRMYIFVVTDEDVMEKIASMRLTIPYMIAYFYGKVNEVPSIGYYELE